MFDKETDQFFQLLRLNTIGEASSIGLRSILESNIPGNVKTFFRADVKWLRTQEKAKEIRSSKFPFAAPELRLLEEQIDLLLINNYTFSRKEFDATADKCIHFLLNFLCRPEWTLQSFFFDTSIRITTEEMLSKLRYCSDYPYYRAILSKYAETRQRTDVGSEEMKRLLSTIDDEVCGTATAAELAYIAKPMFDFLGTIRASMQPPLSARVPVRALIYFYEDKRLAPIAAALSAVRDSDNGFQLTFPMLEMVIEAVSAGSAVPDLAALSETATPDTMQENAAEPLEPYVGTGVMPDDMEYPGGVNETEAPTVLQSETRQAAMEHADEPLRMFGETETEQDELTVMLPPQFTENDKTAITNALFGGDAALFDAAVDTAVNAAAWNEAIASLDVFFEQQSIDPFTKEAMMFTNILESWHRTFKK